MVLLPLPLSVLKEGLDRGSEGLCAAVDGAAVLESSLASSGAAVVRPRGLEAPNRERAGFDWLTGLLSSLFTSSSAAAGAAVGLALALPPKLGLLNFLGLDSDADGASVVVVVVVFLPPTAVRLPPNLLAEDTYIRLKMI